LSLCPKRDGRKRERCIPSLFVLVRSLPFSPGNVEAGPEISWPWARLSSRNERVSKSVRVPKIEFAEAFEVPAPGSPDRSKDMDFRLTDEQKMIQEMARFDRNPSIIREHRMSP
jgi:hypothetical protein